MANWLNIDNNPATVGIAVRAGFGGDRSLYQRHDSGRIFEYTGTPVTGWRELDHNPATVQIVAALHEGLVSPGVTPPEHLYQRHSSGRIFEYTGTPITGWREIDNNPATVSILTAGNVLYQLHDSGRIFRYTGVPITGWQELDNNPATVGIVAAGANLFQLHKDGRIFAYTGIPLTGWQELDANPATAELAAAAGGPHRLYQRHHSGSIFALVDPPIHL